MYLFSKIRLGKKSQFDTNQMQQYINGIFGRSTGLAHLKTTVKSHPLEIFCQIMLSCDDIQYYTKKWLFQVFVKKKSKSKQTPTHLCASRIGQYILFKCCICVFLQVFLLSPHHASKAHVKLVINIRVR